jgi:UDP-N-acetylglucosamine 2-epimerase
MCAFTYAHRRIHDTEHAVIVTLHRDKTEQEIEHQIQELADKLAELVAQGKKLEFSYTFNKGQLIPSFPK